MKVIYDPDTDTMTVVFSDVPVAESNEDKPGVILDYDATGNLVSVEILDASTRITSPSRIRSAMSRIVVYGLAGLCGVTIAQLLLNGHVDWEFVGGMAVGVFAGRGLFEVIIDIVAWRRRRILVHHRGGRVTCLHEQIRDLDR